MSKKHKKFLVIVTSILVTGLLIVFFWWKIATQAPNGNGDLVRFVVTKGKGATQIANDLYKVGLIRSPLAFKFYVQLTGKSKDIQAGEFEVANNLSMFGVLRSLSGSSLEFLVTIPEGIRIEEVVERFIVGLEIPDSKVDQFREDFLSSAKEGYMFPETYFFPKEIGGKTVALRMMGLFNEEIKKLNNSISKSSLSLDEMVVLASIIERETKTDIERPVVAGILMNRLEMGMALQADATAQYAIANERCKMRKAFNAKCNDWWVSPTLEDLKVDSPYNTYIYPGLPPKPVSNPGFSSLSAAANPAKTEYLYYIHENNGTIHYAKTLSEHNANINKFLK